jgi:hypothetical protein
VLAFYLNAWARFEVRSLSAVFSDLNLAALPQSILGRDKVREMANRGEITHDASLPIFTRLSAFSTDPRNSASDTGVEALDAEFKSTGAPNTNNIRYLYIYRQLAPVGLDIIASRPVEYLRYVAKNLYRYLGPAMVAYPVPGGKRNLAKLKPYTDVFNKVFLGQVAAGKPAYMLWFTIPLALLAGFFFSWRGITTRDYSRAAVCFYIVLTITLGSVPVILLSWGDHGRYRKEFDPGYAVLLVLVIDYLFKKYRLRDAHQDLRHSGSHLIGSDTAPDSRTSTESQQERS